MDTLVADAAWVVVCVAVGSALLTPVLRYLLRCFVERQRKRALESPPAAVPIKLPKSSSRNRRGRSEIREDDEEDSLIRKREQTQGSGLLPSCAVRQPRHLRSLAALGELSRSRALDDALRGVSSDHTVATPSNDAPTSSSPPSSLEALATVLVVRDRREARRSRADEKRKWW